VMPTTGQAMRVTNQPNTLATDSKSEAFSMLSSYPD
jgi:hypothetical protein